MAGFLPVLVVLLIAGAIVAIVFGFKAAKKRRLALAAWAHARDWDYAEGKVSSLEDRFPAFDQLQQGSNRYGFNVMRGRVDDRRAMAFDYHYETHSTDSKGNRQTHHHEFSAVVIDSGLTLAGLSIRAEGLFDKVKGAFGFDDIDFESAEFSRKFWVTSASKRWAYDILHQETMEFLLESPRYALEFEDGSQVIALRSRKFKPHEFDEALDLAAGILDRIPKDIRARLRT